MASGSEVGAVNAQRLGLEQRAPTKRGERKRKTYLRHKRQREAKQLRRIAIVNHMRARAK